MFAPMVIRYVDLMEASITQCIRGVPLSNADAAGGVQVAQNASVNGVENASSGGGGGGLASALGSVGSSLASAAVNAASAAAAGSGIGGSGVMPTSNAPIPVSSEELIWKLESLQTFIRELHWTDMVFAEHLDNRLKMMAADMIDAAAER